MSTVLLQLYLYFCSTGTAIYIAPEVLKMKYSLPSDLWSAGVIAYQLVTGRLPFTGEEGEEVSTGFMEKQQFDHKVRLRMSSVSLVLLSLLAYPPFDEENGEGDSTRFMEKQQLDHKVRIWVLLVSCMYL